MGKHTGTSLELRRGRGGRPRINRKGERLAFSAFQMSERELTEAKMVAASCGKFFADFVREAVREKILQFV